MTLSFQMTLPGLRHGRYLSLTERYAEWRTTDAGELAYRAVRAAALDLQARGWRTYGIAALWEAARYQLAVRLGPDAQGFRLNNDYRSLLARELMGAEPALADFFETRRLRAA